MPLSADQADAMVDHARSRENTATIYYDPGSVEQKRAMIAYCNERKRFFHEMRHHFFMKPDSDDRILWMATYDKLIAEKTAEIARYETEIEAMVPEQLAAE